MEALFRIIIHSPFEMDRRRDNEPSKSIQCRVGVAWPSGRERACDARSHVIFSHRWIGWDGPLRSIASVGVSAPQEFVRGHGPLKGIELAHPVVGLIGARSPAFTSQ